MFEKIFKEKKTSLYINTICIVALSKENKGGILQTVQRQHWVSGLYLGTKDSTVYTRVSSDLAYYATLKSYSPKYDFSIYLVYHEFLF